MQSIKAFMQGTIKRVGNRTCNDCGSQVPIYDKDGQEISICLNCDNIKLEEQARELVKNKELKAIQRLIEKYEVRPYAERKNFKTFKYTTDKQKKAHEVTLAFAKGESDITSILLQGSPGLGKTHLAHSVAEVYRHFDKTALFIDSPSLLTKIRESYNRHTDYNQQELMDLIKTVDLLVFDDLGAEYVKNDGGNESWASDILFQVVNARRGKKTVYTTNYQVSDLRNKYGMYSERIVSRIFEGATVIILDGEDYRMKNTNVI